MNLEAIKAILDNPTEPHYCMNGRTWAAYKSAYYAGRMVPPNARRRIWIDPTVGDGECRPGLPNTGWAAPLQ